MKIHRGTGRVKKRQTRGHLAKAPHNGCPLWDGCFGYPGAVWIEALPGVPRGASTPGGGTRSDAGGRSVKRGGGGH